MTVLRRRHGPQRERESEAGQKQPGGAQWKRRGPEQGGSPGEGCTRQRKTGSWRAYV